MAARFQPLSTQRPSHALLRQRGDLRTCLRFRDDGPGFLVAEQEDDGPTDEVTGGRT